MNNPGIYKRYRFPAEIIQFAVWFYYRFNLSHRRCVGPLIEDLLAEREINVSYEAIRLWCNRFAPNLPPGQKENIEDMVIHFTSTRFSSRLMLSNTISGGQFIKKAFLEKCGALKRQ